MQQCQAFKTDGAQCTHDAWRHPRDTHPEHLHLCGTHKNVYANKVESTGGIHHTAGCCFDTIRGWNGLLRRRVTQWCPQPVEPGQHHCLAHNQRLLQRVVQNNNAEMRRVLLMALQHQDPHPTWQEAARAMHAMPDTPINDREFVARRYYRMVNPDMPLWRFYAYWRWLEAGQHDPAPNFDAPPPPPPVPELARLAADNQNVHTRPVTEQTNKATEKLLAVKVPETQQTEKKLAIIWLGGLDVAHNKYLRVATDINKWFNTKDCRAPNDNLYRKMLRGLVALIGSEKDEERRVELYRRCWEECYEAVGMCCEGHISRLCNVMVGFDESFEPPVPFGEILQSKMAAIAGMDIPEEEKRKQATAFFDEHGIPQEERVAWLEAF